MNEFLAIAVAHNGVSQDRTRFDQVLETLLNCDHVPATLCFYAEGIHWLTSESPVLDKLERIGRQGGHILACRHCLAEAGLLNEMIVGQLATEDHIDETLRHAQHTMVL